MNEDFDLIEKAFRKKLLSFERMTRDVEADEDELSGNFGPFDIIGPIQRGGTAMVYLAWDEMSNRKVALKVLTKTREDYVRRLYREVTLALKLAHPNIVRVYGVGQIGRHHYVSMQYIEGHTLREVQYPLPEALRIIEQVARALQYAHDQGVIHRDIKPSNILVDREGRPYLGDFGLAKDVESPLDATATISIEGVVIGTPAYMSPEQAQGKYGLVDRQSDVYSLGATLYWMVTHREPFTGRSPMDIVARVVQEDPRRPREFNPEVPREVEAIILRAMEKDRRHRYSSAEAFADDVRAVLEGRPGRRGLRVRVPNRLKRSLAGAALAAAFLTLLVLAVIGARSLVTPPPVPAAASRPARPMETPAQMMDRARALINDGDYEAAHAVLEALDVPAARYWLGLVDLRLAVADSARQVLRGIHVPERSEEAARAAGEYRLHFREIGSRGELEEHQWEFAQALAADREPPAPLTVETLRASGDLAFLAGRVREAIDYYGRALQALPGLAGAADTELYFVRGLARLRLHLERPMEEDLGGALQDLSFFVKLSARFGRRPMQADGYLLRGYCYKLSGNARRQADDWSVACQINPRYEAVLRQ